MYSHRQTQQTLGTDILLNLTNELNLIGKIRSKCTVSSGPPWFGLKIEAIVEI